MESLLFGMGEIEKRNRKWFLRDDLTNLEKSMKSIKIIVERHSDGYVAYPLGIQGVVVGEGDTYEEALADVQSAIRFHVETFGAAVLEPESPVLEAFVAEANL